MTPVTFTKLFSSITESTVWCENNETRIVWITMLAMANKNGFVFGSVPGLANRARVPVEAAREALRKFQEPDRDSRTKDFEGRRIEEVDGGWRLLNYAKHRAIRDEEERREYMKNFMRDKRSVSNVSRRKPSLSQAEAEAEAEVDAEAIKSNTTPVRQSRKLHFSLPSLGEVVAYCQERKNNVDPQRWFDYYTANGWKVGKNSMKDWRATVRTWERNGFNSGAQHGISKTAVQLREERNRETLRRSLSQIDDPADESKSLFKGTD